MVLSDANFRTEGDKAFDLPAGTYNVLCTLIVDGPSGPQPLTKTTTVKIKSDKTEKVKIEFP